MASGSGKNKNGSKAGKGNKSAAAKRNLAQRIARQPRATDVPF